LNSIEKSARVYRGWHLEKTFIYEGKTLKEILIRPAGGAPRIHGVYTGTITRQLREIEAYFVSFQGGEGFLKTKKTYQLGQTVPIVVVKEPRKDKGYRVSDEVYYKGSGAIYFPLQQQNRFSKKLSPQRETLLREAFSGTEGYLFRTRAQTLDLEVLAMELSALREAHLKALESVAVKASGRIIHEAPLDYSPEAVTDLNEILNLEDLLEEHLKATVVHDKGFRVHFEETRVGHVIDFDSHQFRFEGPHGYLRINQEIFSWLLPEIVLRRLQGVILVDLITMNDPWEKGQFKAWVKQKIRGESAIRSHGITPLGILELTNRVEGPSVMEFSRVSLLLEKLYLRIAYLKEHTRARAFKITLSGKYFRDAGAIEALQEAFETRLVFEYDNSLEEFKIQVSGND